MREEETDFPNKDLRPLTGKLLSDLRFLVDLWESTSFVGSISPSSSLIPIIDTVNEVLGAVTSFLRNAREIGIFRLEADLDDGLITPTGSLESQPPHLRFRKGDPLVYERDALGNPRTIKQRRPGRRYTEADSIRLEALLDDVWERLVQFKMNPGSSIDLPTRGSTLDRPKLTKSQYWYFVRARAKSTSRKPSNR